MSKRVQALPGISCIWWYSATSKWIKGQKNRKILLPLTNYNNKCKSKKKNVAVGAVMHGIYNIMSDMFRDRQSFEIITLQEYCEQYLATYSDKAQSAV